MLAQFVYIVRQIWIWKKSNGEIREIRQFNHGPYRNFTLGREGGPYNTEIISYTAMKRIFKWLFQR